MTRLSGARIEVMSLPRKRNVRSTILASALVLLGALAQAAPLTLDLAPAPLQDALAHFAAISHLQLLYDPVIVSGHRSAGITGTMTPAQALERLLAGTDLTYRFTADDAVAVIRKPDASVPALPTTSSRASADRASATITVTGLRRAASVVPNPTVSALKVDSPDLTSPVTSTSISAQLLREQQAERVEDVLEQISGVEAAPDGQSTSGFSLRGIPTYQYYVDGVRVSPDLHHDGFRDLANIERIDVVKGPASTLYGRTAPGGLINFVTKQPLAKASLTVEQRASALGRLRTQIDAGGPLANPSMRYRLDAAYESGGSFREHAQSRRGFFSSVVTWSPATWAEMTAYLEFLRSDDPLDSGLPLVGSRPAAVPIARSVEDGDGVRTHDLKAGVRGRLDASSSWALRYHFDARSLRTPQAPQLALADDGLDPANCVPDACPVSRTLFSMPVSTGRTVYGSLELQGRTKLLGTNHSILMGGESFDTRGHSVVLYSTADYPTDLFNPEHHAPPPLAQADGAYSSTVLERWTSGYLQDLISFGNAFHLLLGLRYDHVREWLDSAAGIPLADSGSSELADHATKRRAGWVWHPIAPLSVYADYTENFGISTGIYGTGKGGTGLLVPPESAHQWEGGFKLGTVDDRLTGSVAWFELTQVNIALPVSNPVQDAQGFKIITGAARSRGLECDLRASPAPGLQLAASYAFLETRILADAGTSVDANGNAIVTTGDTGNRLFGIPRHGGSVWASYGFPGELSGLRIGLGVTARGWRYGDNENDYTLAGFARWKLLVAYGWVLGDSTLSVQLNVDNLFDARYLESVSGSHTVLPGWPRRWVAGLRWER